MEYWGSAQSNVEERAEAVESLLFANTTGEYYDGKRLSKAIAQTYDSDARTELKRITRELLKDYL